MRTGIYIDRRGRKDGLASVKIAIYKGERTAYIPVDDVEINPEWWDGQQVTRGQDAQLQTARINDTLTKVRKALLMIDGTERMTAFQIRNAVIAAISPDSPAARRYCLRDILLRHSRNLRPKSRSLYEYTAKLVESFAPSVEMSAITRRWLERLEQEMKSRGMSVNTRSIHLRNIRTAYNIALGDGIVSGYPFRQFRIKSEQTEKRSLTIYELRTILRCPCYDWQRPFVDCFLLSFYLCGINLIDLCNLRDEDMHGGRIVYKRSKTGRLYSIKVEPEAQELIDRYRGTDGHLLSIAQRYRNHDDYAKHLTNALRSLGLTYRNGCKPTGEALFPKITQYWCRHTWATLAYELDIPMEVIAQALGHSYGSKVTSIYIRPNQAKADEANRRVIDYLFAE